MVDYEKRQVMLYVTKIPRDCKKKDIEHLFDGFGKIVEVKVRSRYAFIVHAFDCNFCRLLRSLKKPRMQWRTWTASATRAIGS